jgi:hypothetical protein
MQGGGKKKINGQCNKRESVRVMVYNNYCVHAVLLLGVRRREREKEGERERLTRETHNLCLWADAAQKC